MTKSDLLIALKEKYEQWELLLEQIGAAHMEKPGVNGVWSMKDMIAHLTGWNRRLVTRLQAAQRGQPEPLPPWPDNLQSEDEINAWIFEANHRHPVGEVLDESRRVFQELFTAIEGLADDVRIEKIEPKYYLVWVGNQRYEAGEFFDHYEDDHEPDVRAWLMREEAR